MSLQESSRRDQTEAAAATPSVQFEAVEPRVLFSATAMEPVATEAHHEAPAAQEELILGAVQAQEAAVESTPEDEIVTGLNHRAADLEGTERKELVFVSGGLFDDGYLTQHLAPAYEVHVIEPGTDGLRRIAAVLEGREGIDAIHLVSHGEESRLYLGSAVMDASTMREAHAEALQQIGMALSDDAEILIYSQDFGSGEDGQSTANLLAELTGTLVVTQIPSGPQTDPVDDWLVSFDDASEATSLTKTSVGRFAVHGLDQLDSQGREQFIEALAGLEESLAGLADDESGTTILREIFGSEGQDPEAFAEAIRTFLNELEGNSFSLTFDLRDGDDLNGAHGAYAEAGHDGTERIYLNADWINSGAGSQWIKQVLLEEAGHAIDTRLNPGGDSTGDEGEMFVARILGWNGNAQRESMKSDWDHGVLNIDGRPVNVQFASYTFGNAYAVHTQTFAGNTFLAEKEQNRHYFIDESLNITRINDLISSRFFSGNDVVAQMTMGNSTYNGWISRPIKVGGIVRGFYFWSDNDFASIGDATTDGNTDGDRNAMDNFAFILVVDQAYFDGIASEGTTGDGKVIKFIGSSSDRVDSALNALIGPNLAPSPANDTRTVLEDSSGNTGNVLTNDTDGNLDTLTVTGFSINGVAGTLDTPFAIAGVGSFTLGANGTYGFTPLANYAGPVPAVTYTVSDGELSASATLSITITPVNDAPSGTDKTITAKQNLAYTFKASDFGFTDTNDSPANVLQSVVITTLPAKGTLALNGFAVSAGQEVAAADITKLQYTALTDESGTGYSSFTFQVRDNGGTTNGGVNLDLSPNTLTINVAAVNRAPVAGTDTAIAVEAGGVSNGTVGSNGTGNVLGNDTDPDAGDTLTVIAASGAGTTSSGAGSFTVNGLYGTLSLGTDGVYTYVVNNSSPAVQALRLTTDTLTETFNYTISDDDGLTAASTLSVTIQGRNDAPVAVNDTNVAKESTLTSGNYGVGDTTGFVATGNVLTNDTDVDSNGETKTLVSINATATGNTVGASVLTVTPTAQFNNVSVGYYVFVDVGGVKTPVLSSTGQHLTVAAISGTSPRTITLSGQAASLTNGSLLGFDNTTTGSGGNYRTGTLNSAASSSVASTSAQITPGSGVIAVGMTVTGTDGNGAAFSTTVTAVQYNGSGAVSNVTFASSVLLNNASLSFTAAPGTTLTGRYGTLTFASNGTYTYTPTANNPALTPGQSGIDQFLYTMRDTALVTNSATLSITVLGSGVGDPVASPDTLNVNEDAPGSGNLLTNDTGATSISSFTWNGTSGTLGSPMTIVGIGTLTVNSNGSFSFSPAGNYTGSVPVVNYIATNGSALTASTLTISITPLNDAPVALADAATAHEASGYNNGTAGRNATGNVLNNDSDIDSGDSIRVSQVQAGGSITGAASSVTAGSTSALGGTEVTGTYGAFTIGANGSFVYVVNESNADVQALNVGQSLTETFSYTLRDAAGATSNTTVTITIDGANDAPVIASPSGSYNVDEGNYLLLIGLSVADPDDSSLTLSLSVNSGILTLGNTAGLTFAGTNGTSSFTISGSKTDINNALASLVYQGNTEFSGTDTLVLEAVDPGELSAYKTVDITVNPDNRTLNVSGSTVNEASPYVMFQVSGAAGQKTTLAVADTGSGSGHASIGADALPNLEYFNGSSWVGYTGDPVTIPAGGVLLVRAVVLQDSAYEGGETLRLNAINKAGTVATGISTIVDDGTGAVFLATNSTFTPNGPGDSGFPAYLDDDRLVTVNNISVNEASPYAVFTVTGSVGQTIRLSLADGTASGSGTDFGPGLEIFNGSSWVPYTSGSDLTLASTTLLVRTAVVNDSTFEGQESFYLTVERASSGAAVHGTANIYDDGTGAVYVGGNTTGSPSLPGESGHPASLDDDRTVAIDNPTVNEASDYVIFTLTGNSGQSVSLNLINESAGGTITGKADVATTVSGSANLQIYAGVDSLGDPIWESYDPAAALPAFNVDGKIYVRVNIQSEQDAPHEGAETFRLEATLVGQSGASSGTASIIDDGTGVKFTSAISGGAPVTSITSLDDDRVTSVNNITVNEASPYGVFTITGFVGQQIQLALADGTAGASDYGAGLEIYNGSGWLSYTPGSTISLSGTTLLVRTPIANDIPYEGAETFTIEVTNLNNGRVVTGTATIIDDGTGTIFTGDNTTGNPNVSGDPGYPGTLDDDRNAPPVAVDDTFSVAVNGSITIDVLGNDSDPDGNPMTISAVNGTPITEGTTIPVVDGTVKLEGGKLIFTPTPGYTGPASFTYTITDGGYTASATVSGTVDTLSRTVTISDASANEDGSITFTATLDGAVPGGFTVRITAISDIAVAGQDFTAYSGILTFAGTAGETVNFTVNSIDDQLIEGNETFTLVMSDLSISGIDVSDTAIGTILDNDARLLPGVPGEGVTTDIELVANGSGGFDLIIEDVETDSPIGFLSDVPVSDSNDNLLIYRDGADYVIRDTGGLWLGSPIVGAIRGATNEIRVPVAMVTGNIIVRSGIGDDVITIRNLGANLAGDLIVDAEDASDRYLDTDTIHYDSSSTLAAGGDARFRAETINGLASSRLQTTGDGTILWDAGRNISIGKNASLVTNTGDVTLEANLDEAVSGRYQAIVLDNADITSTSGNVRIEGQGGDTSDRNYGVNLMPGSSIVTGGTIDIIGTGGGDGAAAAQLGVIITGSQLRSSGLTVAGTGGNGLQYAAGVSIEKDSLLDSGTGNLAVRGTGGTGGSNNYGVSIAGSELESDGGQILVLGTGSGTNAGIGVRLIDGNVENTGNGSITLRGTGASGLDSNDGVQIQSATSITGENGEILIEGTAHGTGSKNFGVAMSGNSSVSTQSGDGGITVRGTGGFGSFGTGIVLNVGNLTVGDGDLTIQGTGRGSIYGRGVDLTKSNLVSHGAGDIDIDGSGSSAATGSYGTGVYGNGSTLSSRGTGSVLINGTGATGLTLNHGVQLSATRVEGAVVIAITGQARGTMGNATGVSLERGSVVAGSAAANVSISGSGSTAGAAGSRYHRGVVISGSTTSVVNGQLAIAGTGGGGGNGSLNHGVELGTGVIRSTGTGNIVITGQGGRNGTGIHGSKSTISSSSGNTNLTGNSGVGTKNSRGITLVRSILNSSGGGDITARGTAHGNSNGTGNTGFFKEHGTFGTTGRFQIFGTGGGGSAKNHGVVLNKVTRTGPAPTVNGVKTDGSAKSFRTSGNYFD